MEKSLLVPIDFLEPTIESLKYAVRMAEKNNYGIHALHLIKNEGDRDIAKAKLNNLLSSLNLPEGLDCEQHIVVGKIESDIGKLAETLKVNFIVMGTHGASGLDKVFGSKAISVISDSKTPYIVVQDNSKTSNSTKIAMTIDLEKESVQIVKAAIKLAKELNSEIVLVGGDHDDPTLKSKVAVNVNTTRKLLRDNGIESSVELLDRKEFFNNFMNFCRENNVDVIAATYYADTFSIFSKKFVQKLISNDERIPVLTLDSDAISKGSQYSFITV